MSDKLYIWFPRNYLKQNGFLLADKMTLFDSFDSDKKKFHNVSEWAVFSYRQMDFPPPEEKYKFPEEQFLVVKQKIKEILFDYTEYHSDVKIVSETFLSFMQRNGLNDGYEISKLKVVDKNGETITDKPYFALRFGSYNDNLFDFNDSTKQRTKVHGNTQYTFPDLALKQEKKQSIFALLCPSYNQSLIFRQEILGDVLKEFYRPAIYHVEDFPFIYENQYDEEVLAVQNKYIIRNA